MSIQHCSVVISRVLVPLACLLMLFSCAIHASDSDKPNIIRVGPGRALTLPSQAARVAVSGSIVEIDAGDYHGDVAVWRQHDLTIRGIGGRARLHADGRSAQGKAIWVLRGDRVLVENIELSGAKVADHNGAAIRYEGAALTLRHCRLHHNEMGLLTLSRSDARVVIDDCEIDHNHSDTASHGKLGHGIYIGRIAALVLRNSHIHDGSQGHLVKSRAYSNTIVNNRLDDRDGAASYLIDLPNGGRARIIGNQLIQGRQAANRIAIAFAAESGREAPGEALVVLGNRFENDALGGIFVRNFSIAPAQLQDNLVPLLSLQLLGPGKVD